METLVVFVQHRDQYHSRSPSIDHDSFCSPSKDFREINCRTFQSGAGVLPAPLKACSSPVIEQFANSPSVVDKQIPFDQNPRHPKKFTKSSSVPIPINIKHVHYSVKENVRGSLNELFYSELWAGPAYSNSPPPSSLPIPKFSIKPKRTASLDLPSVSDTDVDLLTLFANSAPPSPTGEHHKYSQRDYYNNSDDCATKTLRRILNIDTVDG